MLPSPLISKKFFVSLSFLIILSGCSKYEDGPVISLRTKKQRITNTWVIYQTSQGGSVSTGSYFGGSPADFALTIERDGTFRWTNFYDGTWRFNEDKDELILLPSGGASYDELRFKITRLKHKELWLKDVDSGSQAETYYFKPL